MANSWFEFKQFKIFQDRTAMKVGTDGVLLGAWVNLSNSSRALDIGTGTGLIALMMAQRDSQLEIHALEIECDAAIQAKENICNSHWANRIDVENISFQDYIKSRNEKFDLIVTNPPFFSTSVKSACGQRSMARHADVLPHEIILSGARQLLTQEGTLSIILPVSEFQLFSKIAINEGFNEQRRLTVFPTLNKPAARVLSQWGFQKRETVEFENLVIEPNYRHNYSPEYIALAKDFYLYM